MKPWSLEEWASDSDGHLNLQVKQKHEAHMQLNCYCIIREEETTSERSYTRSDGRATGLFLCPSACSSSGGTFSEELFLYQLRDEGQTGGGGGDNKEWKRSQKVRGRLVEEPTQLIREGGWWCSKTRIFFTWGPVGILGIKSFTVKSQNLTQKYIDLLYSLINF